VLTASAGTMTATSGGGVTVTNSGTGAITLTGTASAIDAYLNSASAVRYTGALNANGDNAATLTITANDGSGTVTLGVVNIDITPVNDAPTITGLPTDVTVVEDVTSNLNLSTVTLTDVDTTGSITVVLTASAGTMTATSGGGVTVTNSGTGAITLTGTASAIDAYLNSASAVRYTSALNASGDNAATLTITANDGSGAVTLGVVNIDITPVNDASRVIDLSSLTPSQGFVIQGTVTYPGILEAGYSVSSAGDVNGDGIDDVIVGAPIRNIPGDRDAGEAYVIYGQAGASRGLLDLATLSASQGFAIKGLGESHRNADFQVHWGQPVTSAGDVNGDGIDDVIIAVRTIVEGGPDVGKAYVIYGQAGSSRGPLDVRTLSASQGFEIQGLVASGYTANSVSSAGDINGDGLDDVIVGTPFNERDPGGLDAGEAYVIYGQAGTSRGMVDVRTLSASQGFVIQGDVSSIRAGWAVSDAGDVNGDGIDDLIVGVPFGNIGGRLAGEAYVVYGQAGAARGRLDLSTFSPSQGFIINGNSPGDFAGWTVSSAGDVNGDGIDDLCLSAPYGDGGIGLDPGDITSLINAGQAYVIYGQAGTSRGRLDLSTLSASQGFVIQEKNTGVHPGLPGGLAVSSAGDVNGDGYADLIVGSPLSDDGGLDAGQAYVIYGQAGASRGQVDLSTLSPSQGFIIQGDAPGDRAGLSVSSAGDVNDDGFDDLIVGAPFAGGGGDGAGGGDFGKAYVIYGFGNSQPTASIQSLNFAVGIPESSENPTVTIDVQFEAGVTSASALYWLKNGQQTWVNLTYDEQTGSFQYQGEMSKYAASGVYEIRGITFRGSDGIDVRVFYNDLTQRGFDILETLTNPNSDSAAPVLSSFTFGESYTDSSGAFVIPFSLTAADVGPSGILGTVDPYIVAPNGNQYATRVTLDTNGAASGQFVLSPNIPAGSYQLHSVRMTDLAGNYSDNRASLEISPITTSITNANEDLTPPTLTDFSLSAVFDPITDRPRIVIEGQANDFGSNMQGVYVSLSGPTNTIHEVWVYHTWESFEQRQSTLEFSNYLGLVTDFNPGNYRVGNFFLQDSAGNASYFTAESLAALGFSGLINVFFPATPSQVVVTASDKDDFVFGTNAGSESLFGGLGNDYLFGGEGNDTIAGGSGNNTIDGGAGWDVVTVSGPASAYRLLKDGDNFILKGPDGGDSLTNVEVIRFADGKVLDLARMYGSDVDATAWADGRIPDELLSGEGPRPLVWVQETMEKDVMPEVLPAADDAGLDRFGEPGPLIGVFGGGSDPSIPLTLNDDTDDFLTAVGGMNDSDLLFSDLGDRVDVAAVARPQFNGDRVMPGLMNGGERELRIEADGWIPEAGLSDEKAGWDRPLVLLGADDAQPVTVKDGDQPEVLPGADDGDHWILKDEGEPLVLPGAAPDEVLIAKDGGGPEVLPAVDNVVTGAKAFDGPEVLPAMADDRVAPEVLPVMDDGFVLTDKVGELPPVMPAMDEFDVALLSLTEMQQARELMMALIRENPLDASRDSLTLLDDWSGVAPPSREEVWA